MERVAAIEAHDLYRFYHAGTDETLALRGVSFSVYPGELVAVMGPSGSGKSTLLACLAGIDEPDGGWVAVAGERVTRRPEASRARIRARKVGTLLQSGNLVDHLSVNDNLHITRTLGRTTGGRDILDLLAALGIAHRAAAFPPQLSGGELARAGMAVALANDPAILLADEPTGEIDAANERNLIDLLRAHAASGGATLVVTHSPTVAEAADRVIRLVDGRIVDA